MKQSYCGGCELHYKRAVCKKRNGERQAVWHCISRLDYGTKCCKNSVTVDEESLHEAIMQAIHATCDARQNAIPFLLAHLERTLRERASSTVGENHGAMWASPPTESPPSLSF